MEHEHDRGGPATAEPAFRISHLTKTYPGVTALDDVTLEAYPGEVLAICGANGAGKSTLSKLLAGQERPTAGGVTVAGYDGEITDPSSAIDAGVLFMHQEPLVIEDFTVEENVWLTQISKAGRNRPWNLVRRHRREQTLEALAAVGMRNVPLSARAGQLGPGPRQMLALSRTQVNPHRILILDETTASTTEDHFKDVLALVDRERAAGVCVIFVSHRMDEVFAMADRIAVLRNGALVDTVVASEVSRDDVMTLMIGESVMALEPPQPLPQAERAPVLRVDSLYAGAARAIDLDVAAGEIVGLYGLVGSGRSSVARAISGNQETESGSIELHGKARTFRSNRDAIAAGIVYVSEDRKREGFIPSFANGQNMTLSTLGAYSSLGVIDLGKERARTRELIDEYAVKGGTEGLTVALSGGNQQKVCLAKWLEADPDVVVLDEPTKGIDIGARLTIYTIIRRLAEQGKAVIVVSSEAEELLSLCHRVLVMRDGRIVSEHASQDSATDQIIRAALGGEAA
ncbi:sugar ABC transporter ATP-binding protein [Sediminivirga luteola]|uniref:Ribose ABC transporter n=1 Tax=Sediminivirga luteola TaxID=1774748 RepID=A0A8J2TZ58_9MICO|nr:sugar ABC transporter ATP-binding protein [Sediminivirga luteola]MCI2264966.1 sugar ABC transporter ATP-binding protein [Sediminivirga luteola]GGA19584.1 ribose ABC transporter [Sediminivirga luteola]